MFKILQSLLLQQLMSGIATPVGIFESLYGDFDIRGYQQ